MKSSSFKQYLLSTWKTYMYLPALSLLLYALSLLPLLGYLSEATLQTSPRWQIEERLLEAILPGVSGNMSRGSSLFLLITLGLAALTGLVHFAYLHDMRQVDLYHALPLKREKHFLSRFLCAILGYLPSLLVTLLAAALFLLRGFLFKRLLAALLIRLIAGFVFYVLTYLTASLAMLLTGRLLIGILGSLVFFGCLPLFHYLLMMAKSSFYRTYWIFTPIPEWNLSDASPVTYAVHTLQTLPYREGFIALLFGALLCPLFLALCLFLFKKRSLEAAGNAMAFSSFGYLIQVFLGTLGGLILALMFAGSSNDSPLLQIALPGFLGTLLVHLMINFLYQWEVHSLFRRKGCFLLALLLSLGILFFYQRDLSGYDSYLAKEENIQEVSLKVGIGDINSFSSQQNLEVLRDRTLPLTEEIYALLSHLAKEGGTIPPEGEKNLSALLYYKEKSGKEVYHSYRVGAAAFREEVGSLFDIPAYKESVYTPLLPGYQCHSISILSPEGIHLSEESYPRILQALQKDVEALTSRTVKEEIPLVALDMTLRKEKKPEEEKEVAEDIWHLETIDTNAFLYGSIYLYPSFTNTLSLLKDMGYDPKNGPEESEIEKIILHTYANGYQTQEEVFTEEEDIKALAPRLVYYPLCTIWQDTIQNCYADVYYKEAASPSLTAPIPVTTRFETCRLLVE